MENISKKLLERLAELDKEYDEILMLLESVEICQDSKLLKAYQKKKNRLEPLISVYKKYKKNLSEISLSEELLSVEADVQERGLISQNIELLNKANEELTEQINKEFEKLEKFQEESARIELVNSSSKESLQIVLDIIKNYSDSKEYSFEQTEQSSDGAVLKISGENAYKNLLNLSGLYEIISKGKSEFVSLLVFSDNQEQFEISEDDIKVEYSKSSGAGGQHINKTESAVRLIHIPTGITAECQDERSQIKNKDKAMENLKQKISQSLKQKAKNQYDFERKSQKNAVFSKTPTFLVDFDRNKFTCGKIKTDYDLKTIITGNLSCLFNDLSL